MLGAVAAAWEREDVNAILSGVFDLNAKLLRIGEDVGRIRYLLEDEDEEEEEDDEGNPGR
jgi:hypothetical protein